MTNTSQTPPGHEARLFAGVALFLVLVGAATLIWGLPGLAMSALVCVPACFAVILWITVGK